MSATALAGMLACAQAASVLNDGFWLVAGSFKDPDNTNPQYAAIKQASEAVKRCGLEPFNDFSVKFEKFAEGFDVVVVGAYRTEAQARVALAKLKPCVPEPFIKAGRYLGE
ncbi:SPOR domain-containing protein [Methylobacterium sp. C25]|uniref:SPOR domain-containing protein n=1 Tax=Methylobacterium sp. C25 TaxID=2721622 RepID=UPI001F33840C|nr:SPOR domain-containing protein [Methylobacterium sp. C25]MCE4222395.1 SPOR domain-containing protein [Methylobacterium sp. C25]